MNFFALIYSKWDCDGNNPIYLGSKGWHLMLQQDGFMAKGNDPRNPWNTT